MVYNFTIIITPEKERPGSAGHFEFSDNLKRKPGHSGLSFYSVIQLNYYELNGYSLLNIGVFILSSGVLNGPH